MAIVGCRSITLPIKGSFAAIQPFYNIVKMGSNQTFTANASKVGFGPKAPDFLGSSDASRGWEALRENGMDALSTCRDVHGNEMAGRQV